MICDKVRVEVKETRSYTARSRMTADYLRLIIIAFVILLFEFLPANMIISKSIECSIDDFACAESWSAT